MDGWTEGESVCRANRTQTTYLLTYSLACLSACSLTRAPALPTHTPARSPSAPSQLPIAPHKHIYLYTVKEAAQRRGCIRCLELCHSLVPMCRCADVPIAMLRRAGAETAGARLDLAGWRGALVGGVGVVVARYTRYVVNCLFRGNEVVRVTCLMVGEGGQGCCEGVHVEGYGTSSSNDTDARQGYIAKEPQCRPRFQLNCLHNDRTRATWHYGP
ncbi:hypothetical protein IWX49DRAFT_155927 [Phyllosticta citricarpa]|uniref:Uncharacterized protein n=1 Tax=Phyllosticta citricarpa TaxID=55181 RepID=A0ABR1MLG1_9PEZI